MKKFRQQILKLFICILVFTYSGMQNRVFATDNGSIKVTSTQANLIINTYQNLIILDLRDKTEFQKRHILGAIPMPFSFLRTEIQSLNKNASILVYGKEETRRQACTFLWDNGFKSLFSLVEDFGDLSSTDIALSTNVESNRTHGIFNLKNSSITNTKTSFSAPDYCNSNGGNSSYENIQNIKTSILSENVLAITVEIYISNPEGCVFGSPCKSYDGSPEYINAWIDWNGDNVFAPEERVLNAVLTGYTGLNYKGTMSTSTVVNIPSDAQDLTWIRVNVGWDYDPNDPCEKSWKWGDVEDKEIIVSNKPPVIEDIVVKGIGVPNENYPLTSDPSVTNIEKVRLEAIIKENDNYEITEINWSGTDIISGKGNEYEYIANAGTHGSKKVECMVIYKHKKSGAIGKLKMSKEFELFFHKDGHDKGTKKTPNWFRYWKKDKAVPDMESAKYDAAKLGYGSMSGLGTLTLGPIASGQHYSSPIVLQTTFGTESFGGPSVTGIDCAAEIIAHENYHKWVNKQWLPFGDFILKEDSDKDTKNNKNDRLPDSYEKNTSKTDISKTDTYNLEIKKSKVYSRYGDEEYMAMRAGDSKRGIKSNDWSFPGKQTENTSTKSASLFLKSLTTEASTDAIFTGNYSDTAIDENNNGAYDILRIGAEINVNTGGVLGITVKLNDPDTNLITFANKVTTLESGTHNLMFDLDGVDISEYNADGPYFVTFVMVNGYGDEIDAQYNTYFTKNYDANDFKLKDASFTNQYIEGGKDIDGDSKYDSLIIQIGIEVKVADVYTLEAGLYDSLENVIEIKTKNISLAKGNHKIPLSFDGKLINSGRIDGPYFLKDLGISNENLLDFKQDAYISQPYGFNEFQSSFATFNGELNFKGIDTDNDTLYNFLRANIGINSKTAGQYKVIGSLFDKLNNQITENEVLVNLVGGNNTVEFDFKGETIHSYGVDGPYFLESLTLINENGIMVDQFSLGGSTSFFAYTDFQKPEELLVTILGVYEDYKTDKDTDCIYDDLTIKSAIALADSGFVIAKAKLEDVNGDEICWSENIVFLNQDSAQHILLSFDGESIYKHGVNGPYSVKNFYIYHSGDPSVPDYVVNAHTTKDYYYNEFDTIAGMQVNQYETICEGDSIQIGDTVFYEPGQYTLKMKDINHCDSTLLLTLDFYPVYNETKEVTICQGDKYTFGKNTYTEEGEYSEIFESAFGCDSTVNLTLNVSSVEKPTLNIDADTLTCNIMGGFSWYFNDELMENVTTQSYIIETSGKYQVSVTNEIGCQSPISDSLFVVKTSVEYLDFAKNINIYPNPTNGDIRIEGLNIEKEPNIQVFDITGRKILQKQVTSPQIHINIQDKTPGIYNLIISQGNRKVNYKIVKQ